MSGQDWAIEQALFRLRLVGMTGNRVFRAWFCLGLAALVIFFAPLFHALCFPGETSTAPSHVMPDGSIMYVQSGAGHHSTLPANESFEPSSTLQPVALAGMLSEAIKLGLGVAVVLIAILGQLLLMKSRISAERLWGRGVLWRTATVRNRSYNDVNLLAFGVMRV